MFVTGDKFVTLNTEGIHKEVQEFRRHSTVVDETADVTDLAFLHFLLELGDEVGTAGGVVNQYISITGNFDAVAGVDVVAGKNEVEVRFDGVVGSLLHLALLLPYLLLYLLRHFFHLCTLRYIFLYFL